MNKITIANVLLPVRSVRTLTPHQQTEMMARFNQFGFVILDGDPEAQSKEDFAQLEQYFGQIIRHNQSDELGILPITLLPDYPDYANTHHHQLALHTDGAFETVPPAVMAMQCEVADATGGLSCLVDGYEVYQYLHQVDPVGLQYLFEPDVFHIERDNQSAQRAIFWHDRDGRLKIAFRSDTVAKIRVKPCAQAVFERIKDYLADPDHQFQWRLQPGQILIFDNMRMLHGRTAFPPNSQRQINGLWFKGQAALRRAVVV
ncbi:TauD/TfdA family dioxygenase [Trichothermofontia sp.]